MTLAQTRQQASPTVRGRILILSENQPLPEDRRVLREAEALMDAGFAVTVICPLGVGQSRSEELAGIRFERYPPRESGGGVVGYIVEYANCLFWTLRLSWRVLRSGGFDVIHACNPPDLFFLIAAPYKIAGKRFVYDQHDLCPELFESRFGSGWKIVKAALLVAERATYGLADAVIVTNNSYADVARTRGRVVSESLFVVRNGPPRNWPVTSAPNPAIKEGREYMALYLGVMNPQDGVEELIRVMRHLVHDLHRLDILLVLAGSGDSIDALVSLAAELDVSQHVRFVGWVRDEGLLAEYLATADVCLCPEPSSPLNDRSSFVKVVEYMAAMKPTVAFDLPETRVTAGGAVQYATPGDLTEFASLIVRVLDEAALRERMVRESQERLQDLSWEAQIPELERAYSSLGI